MGQKTANIDIRVEPQLVERIDAWRARQRVSPSRTAAIIYMIEQFLKHDPPEVTAAIISMASYVQRKLGVPDDPEAEVARIARDALDAFWAEIARAIPARRGVETIEIAEIEALARLAVRSWIYANEDEEGCDDVSG
jgi:hypothetical protein